MLCPQQPYQLPIRPPSGSLCDVVHGPRPLCTFLLWSGSLELTWHVAPSVPTFPKRVNGGSDGKGTDSQSMCLFLSEGIRRERVQCSQLATSLLEGLSVSELSVCLLTSLTAKSALIRGSPCRRACSQPASLPSLCRHWEGQQQLLAVTGSAWPLSTSSTGNELQLTWACGMTVLYSAHRSHMSLHMPLRQTLSLIFHSFPSRLLKADKPLVTAHEAIYILILAFSLHIKWKTKCVAQILSTRNFSTLLFQDHPWLRLYTAEVYFWLTQIPSPLGHELNLDVFFLLHLVIQNSPESLG